MTDQPRHPSKVVINEVNDAEAPQRSVAHRIEEPGLGLWAAKTVDQVAGFRENRCGKTPVTRFAPQPGLTDVVVGITSIGERDENIRIDQDHGSAVESVGEKVVGAL